MVDTGLIQNLKTYINDHYELHSAIKGVGAGVLGPLKLPHKPLMGNAVNKMGVFIKEKRTTETFSVLLDKYRDAKGLTAQQLYGAAMIDRKLYSKIMGNRLYHPTKNTAIQFGIALKLSRGEMDELLLSAGFVLANNSVSDLVIAFCVENGIYNLFDVNALLVSQSQKVLMREL
jgi:hypothetical protein